MALIQELHKPNIILLQAGVGPYNQDPKVAALALKKFFDPDVVVPMHYGMKTEMCGSPSPTSQGPYATFERGV